MVLYEPPTNVSTATDMMVWINSTTSLWMFQGIISIVFVISLISMLRNPNNTPSKSFAASAFVTMLIAVLARTLNFVPTGFMSIWIILTGLASLWLYVEGTV